MIFIVRFLTELFCVQFDLRQEKSTKLFICHHLQNVSRKPARKVVRLNAIVMNPRNVNYFAVGGSDQYARVYDIRRVTANSSDDRPVDCFAPKKLMGPGKFLFLQFFFQL